MRLDTLRCSPITKGSSTICTLRGIPKPSDQLLVCSAGKDTMQISEDGPARRSEQNGDMNATKIEK